MPFGKSQEEKDAELAAARQAVVDRARVRAAREASTPPAPSASVERVVAWAQAAAQRGDGFFQAEMDVSALDGRSQFGSSQGTETRSGGPSDLLGRIEALGWHLEHVGYVFVETGSTSTDRFFSTGEGTVTRGVVRGIYLFRAVASKAE